MYHGYRVTRCGSHLLREMLRCVITYPVRLFLCARLTLVSSTGIEVSGFDGSEGGFVVGGLPLPMFRGVAQLRVGSVISEVKAKLGGNGHMHVRFIEKKS